MRPCDKKRSTSCRGLRRGRHNRFIGGSNHCVQVVAMDEDISHWRNDVESSQAYTVLSDPFWGYATDMYFRWQIGTGNRTKPNLNLQAYTRKSRRLCVQGGRRGGRRIGEVSLFFGVLSWAVAVPICPCFKRGSRSRRFLRKEGGRNQGVNIRRILVMENVGRWLGGIVFLIIPFCWRIDLQ